VDGATFDPTPLQAQMDALAARVTALEAQVATNITNIQTNVDGLAAEVKLTADRTTALEARLDALANSG
jgi:cell division protein FtsB